MADVFISYAQEDRDLARSLAAELTANKLSVWWDADILSSDNYYKAILGALTEAKAAIVIWTKNSVQSLFVRDEARFALHYNKLVAVKEPGLTIIEIPFGFQSQHTEDISAREKIVAALAKLGASPSGRMQPGDPTAQQVAESRSVNELLELMARTTSEEVRGLAARRLTELMREKGGTAQFSPQTNALTRSKWRAFWSGLTFRPPEFALQGQGRAAAVGVAFGSVILSFLAMGIASETLPTRLAGNPALDAIIPAALPWLLNLYLFRSFFAQRAFWSGWLLVGLWLLFTMILGLGLFHATYAVLGVTNSAILLVALPVAALVYALYEFRRRR